MSLKKWEILIKNVKYQKIITTKNFHHNGIYIIYDDSEY